MSLNGGLPKSNENKGKECEENMAKILEDISRTFNEFLLLPNLTELLNFQ